MFILQKGPSTSTGTKKALPVNSKVTLTVNGNLCSSISRNEHERSFLSTRREGLHSQTNIEQNGAEARTRRTQRRRHAKQLHQHPNFHVRTCCQYHILTWRQQANLAQTSKQPLKSYVLSAEQPREFVHRWRPGAAKKSGCHRNSTLCIQMYAWDPWTWLNRPELLSSPTLPPPLPALTLSAAGLSLSLSVCL